MLITLHHSMKKLSSFCEKCLTAIKSHYMKFENRNMSLVARKTCLRYFWPGQTQTKLYLDIEIGEILLPRHWKMSLIVRKTGLRGFRPGPTQTGLHSYRRYLEAWNFGFRKKGDCTIRVAKTKALISFAVIAKLICVFVFAYVKSRFSHDVV